MLSFALEVTIQLIGENIKTYLNAMKECVAPQDIMRRFVASGSNNSNQAGGGSSTIGEFKDVLINMVQADTFDVFVGECLVRMNFTDLTTLHRQKTQLMVRSFYRITASSTFNSRLVVYVVPLCSVLPIRRVENGYKEVHCR